MPVHKKKVVAVSGGFDPVHIGHVRMFEEAKKLGNELVVILNNDNWLTLKKGFAFMPEQERKEIIEEFKPVDRVVLTGHGLDTVDMSVCTELEEIHPDIFANGGDRKPDDVPVPEVDLCERLGIEMVYNVGHGGKVQSSSWLTAKIKEQREKAAEALLSAVATIHSTPPTHSTTSPHAPQKKGWLQNPWALAGSGFAVLVGAIDIMSRLVHALF